MSYLAQVLKRNRTLKVLNLSENKLDVACLVMIADALVGYLFFFLVCVVVDEMRNRNIIRVWRHWI